MSHLNPTWSRPGLSLLLVSPLLLSGLSGCEAPRDEATRPIEAPAEQWTYVPFANTACGNGEPYGLAINPHPSSKKVVIFMQGGGWCWNSASCQRGLFNITDFTFTGIQESDVLNILQEEKGGLYDRGREENPLKDYHMVFLPYCSGDMHSGTAGATSYGITHRGAENIKAFLARLVPTFADAEEVVLAGDSAGGFGALLNHGQVQEAFGDTPVHLLSDSAPPLASGYMPQALLDEMWGAWKPAFQAGCPECRDFFKVAQQWSRKYPQRRLAFISSTDDWLMRRLWVMRPDGTPAGSMPGQQFYDALIVTSKALASGGNVRFFVDRNDQHVYTDKSVIFATRSGTTALTTWVGDMVAGAPAWASLVESRGRDGSGGAGEDIIGVDTADPAGDERLRYPTDPSFTQQQDIRNVNIGHDGETLRITFTMASVTNSWSPTNGFDHVSFSVYIDLPGQEGLEVLPEANATAPTGFKWDLFHRAFGWGNAIFSKEGAGPGSRGTQLDSTPGSSVDIAARTVTFIYKARELGLTSWDGARVYASTFDVDGIADRYRSVSAAGGAFEYGGGSPDSARIMDDTVVLTLR